MDEVIVLLRMGGGDYALIYQIARSERKTVNEWILTAILEKLEKVQQEWTRSKSIKSGNEKE
ncbi:MAG: hypothetical protein QXG54_05155 [Desulfurococcaceae archaeon]